MKFTKNPHFQVEVAANGFILQVHTPDHDKTPGSTATFIFPTQKALFDQMSVYLGYWEQEVEESVSD